MEPWDEDSDKVTRMRPDQEKSRALLKMASLREERVALTPTSPFVTLLVEEYYEIIKELITAILSADGWKTVSHELLVGYLAKNCGAFNTAEIRLIDQLRVMRNDIAYRGVMIPAEYLERNKRGILVVISKLKRVLQARLSDAKTQQ